MSQHARNNPEHSSSEHVRHEAFAELEANRSSYIHHDLLLAMEDNLISREYAIELSEARNLIKYLRTI